MLSRRFRKNFEEVAVGLGEDAMLRRNFLGG
jgi:hypothetical protein